MSYVLAFLQARMGSSRLPGKALLKIQGKTILERAIDRLRAARTVNGVVVLTTRLEEDGAIEREASRLGVPSFRGSQRDVLKRFQDAAEEFRPEIIIRATADNPLIDIGSVDRIVQALHSSNLDYAMEDGLPIGAATEAVSRRTLKMVARVAQKPDHREHVTLYIKEHPELFRLAYLAPPDCLKQPNLRLTVDTPEDFIQVESLIQRVPESSRPVPLERYLRLSTSPV